MSKTTKQNQKKQKSLYWITGAIVVVLVALFFLNKGSEPDSAIEITPVGTEASVFIDRSRVNSLSPNTPTTYNVSTGRHQVLVAQDGFWPWTESIAVNEKVSKLHPFLIEETGQRAVQTPTEITSALSAKQSQPVPSANNPVISPNENIRVYVDSDTNIIAQWTAGTSTAPDFMSCYEGTCGVSVHNNQPVRDIAFYPGRNDVIFFSTNTGVYAIEIDPSDNTQNFQPVVEGVSDPVFALDEGRIFVSAGGRITVSEI